MTLPAHTIRQSPRAKRPRLTISRRDGLVVVIPKQFSRRKVPAILRANRQWIDRHLADLATRRATDDPGALPDRISFQAINEEWTVTYRSSDSAAVTTSERSENQLLVTGATDSIKVAHASLRRWLKRRARKHLIPALTEQSGRLGLPFNNTRIGLPRTRWGSCSARHGQAAQDVPDRRGRPEGHARTIVPHAVPPPALYPETAIALAQP